MLKGAFNTCRHAADHFRKQESGSFVHMTSTAGLIGAMGQVNYGAAKLGLVGLSKNISIDMQRFNVRSNCIAPVAWTRMTASIPPNDPAAAKRIEQRKQVTPEFNAPLAVFLASDAAKDVTGQVFAVRKNEIFLMSQSRPLRGIHRGRRLDAADLRRAHAAGAEELVLPARPHGGRVPLGFDMTVGGEPTGESHPITVHRHFCPEIERAGSMNVSFEKDGERRRLDPGPPGSAERHGRPDVGCALRAPRRRSRRTTRSAP